MTDRQSWLSRRYLVYRALSSMWFVSVVWLYFYRLFVADAQVGLLDGLAFGIGLLAEVPSGALADRFGRDRLTRLGQLLTAVGLLYQVAFPSFVNFVLGQAITMVGVSLVSGADEAMFFHELGFERSSTAWRRLVTRGGQAALLGSLVATVSGGWLQMVDARVPWYLTAVAFVGSVIAIWPVRDSRSRVSRQKFQAEVRAYVADIRTGFGQFRLPQLSPYVPIIVVVQGLFYAYGFGLLRIILLSRFGFSPLAGAVAVGICIVLTVGLFAWMHHQADQLRERPVIMTIVLSAAGALLAALGPVGWWGWAVIFVLYAGEHVLSPFMSETLNRHAPEGQRATVLSVASFMRAVPYVVLAPVIGALNTAGHLGYFLVIWTFLIGLAVAQYAAASRRIIAS